MGQSECKGCSAADPTTDTVKVNPNAVTSENQVKLAARAQQVEDELRANREIEEAKKHREETQRRAELERERLQRETEEKEAREARELQQAEEAAAAEAEQKRQEQEQAAAEAAAAEAAEVEKNRARAEEMARKGAEHKSEEFLKNHGFKAPAAPKTSCFAHVYPLHTAVKENNAEAVKALVACGADPQVKSSGKTPLDVAQKLNKRESHQAVIAALGGC